MQLEELSTLLHQAQQDKSEPGGTYPLFHSQLTPPPHTASSQLTPPPHTASSLQEQALERDQTLRSTQEALAALERERDGLRHQLSQEVQRSRELAE